MNNTYTKWHSLLKYASIALGVSAVCLVLFGFSQPTFAGVGLGVAPTIPSPVTVGETGVPASLDITNTSSAGEVIDLTSIKMTPQCGDFSAPCSDGDPGVFSLSATGTGADTCTGVNFTITEVNPATGQVAFTPDATVTLAVGQKCIINFTVDVLQSPTKDAQPAVDGIQTAQTSHVEAVENGGTLPGAGTGSSAATVLDPSTDVGASVDLSVILSGTEVTLTITETNDGDAVLSNPYVNLSPLGLTLDSSSVEFDGTDDGADGLLSPGETWQWTVTDSPNSDTTYVAIGHGTTVAGDDVTWCEDTQNPDEDVLCDQDERDEVSVDVIAPSTITTILSSESVVDVGGTVDLTITEENDGDVDLTNPSVTVDNGVGTLDENSSEFTGGDDGDGILEVGETWSWTVTGVVVNADTTFTATGVGTDPLGNDVTWTSGCAVQDPEEGVLCDADEQDDVTVEVRFNPGTEVSAEVDLSVVVVGDEVELTITETNDGDVDLTDAFVDLQPLGLTLDEGHVNFSSNLDADSTLDVGETWTWTVADTPASDTTYVAIGHGDDPDGNDVTWCEDTQNPPLDTLCDQDERDSVDVDVIEPSTTLSITSSELEVASGEMVTLTITEENDGDADLINPYVEVDNGVGTLDENSPEFIGTDDGGDGILSVGEVWQWEVEVQIDSAITFIATGHGTDPLGNDVTYPDDADEQDSVSIETIFLGCTYTQGYWGTHSVDGPAAHPDETWNLVGGPDTILAGSEYSWLEVFNTPPKGGNVWYQLAHQWMAAYLNTLSGADVPSDVQNALDDGENWLEEHDADAKLKGKDYPEAADWASLLGSYNEGDVGPGHCDDDLVIDES